MMTFETSETTAKLDAALAEAQGHIEAALKEKENEAFRRGGKASKYADLNAVWTAARPALSAAKIAVTQWPVHSDDGRLHMVTRLAHEGEWMKAEFSIPVSNPTAHGFGGAITYARRFCFAAAVGVVTDEDDDGNAASKPANGIGRDPDVRDMTGNPDAKHYKSNGTTAKALEARGNNEFFSKCQTEIRQAQTPEALREWAALHKAEISQKLSPAAVETLQEVYENHKADLLARMPA